MTNHEKWRFYLKDCTAPDAFIDWGFYYLISSALQRRIWTGCEAHRLFANLFVIFVADPGVGKGLVTTQIDRLLRHHRYVKKDEEVNAQEIFSGSSKKDDDWPLLFPIAADAVTYEKLVSTLARSIRALMVKNPNNNPSAPNVPYLHCSCSFILDELASVFKRYSEDTEKFLLQAYGCGDYRNDTVSRGKDYIKNCCVNLLAGTQPSYIRKVLGAQILTDGFSSRAHFIYEMQPRGLRARPQEESPEQKQVWLELADWLKKLSTVYGECKFTKEAVDYLEEWWIQAQNNKPNNSPLLKPYYGRKNIGVQKVAMAIHYGKSLDMELGLEELKEGIRVVEKAEKKMHFALTFDKRNPLALVTEDVFKSIIEHRGRKKQELLIEFYEELPNGKESLDQVLGYLISVGKVVIGSGKYEVNPKRKKEEEEELE